MLSVLISCSERHHMAPFLSDIENKYLAGTNSPGDYSYLRAYTVHSLGFQ